VAVTSVTVSPKTLWIEAGGGGLSAI
jgi:hypothetical protein